MNHGTCLGVLLPAKLLLIACPSLIVPQVVALLENEHAQQLFQAYVEKKGADTISVREVRGGKCEQK
jgi:hypothetical protein